MISKFNRLGLAKNQLANQTTLVPKVQGNYFNCPNWN